MKPDFFLYFYQGYGTGGAIELRDKNLLFLEFPGNEVLSFYDIKDVLDQYDCTGYKRDLNPELNLLMFVI